jgi:outer membrane protein assembly factor BamB
MCGEFKVRGSRFKVQGFAILHPLSSILFVCGSAALGLAPFLAPAENWPQLGGPRANGISSETGLNTNWAAHQPPVRWTVPLHDSGWAAATIVDGTVYIVDYASGKDVLRALDLATGTQRWESPYKNDSQSGPGHTRGCPVFDQGKLYVFSLSCCAWCFDAGTGKVVWTRNLRSDYAGRGPDFGYSASPLVDGDQVIYVPGGRGASVVALDKLTGATRWKSGDDPAGHATPVAATIHGVKQYVLFNGYGAVGVKADDGRQLWRHQWYTQHNCNAAQPLVMGHTVFITSGYGVGCALLRIDEQWKATELWKSKEIIGRTANPVLHQGHLYCTDETDRLICLDLKTKRVVWGKEGFGAPVGAAWKEGFTCGSGGLILVDGVLLVVAERSKSIVAVKATPQGYQELGRLSMPFQGTELFTTPSFSDGKLVVRDKKNLFCVDLGPAATP